MDIKIKKLNFHEEKQKNANTIKAHKKERKWSQTKKKVLPGEMRPSEYSHKSLLTEVIPFSFHVVSQSHV